MSRATARATLRRRIFRGEYSSPLRHDIKCRGLWKAQPVADDGTPIGEPVRWENEFTADLLRRLSNRTLLRSGAVLDDGLTLRVNHGTAASVRIKTGSQSDPTHGDPDGSKRNAHVTWVFRVADVQSGSSRVELREGYTDETDQGTLLAFGNPKADGSQVAIATGQVDFTFRLLLSTSTMSHAFLLLAAEALLGAPSSASVFLQQEINDAAELNIGSDDTNNADWDDLNTLGFPVPEFDATYSSGGAHGIEYVWTEVHSTARTYRGFRIGTYTSFASFGPDSVSANGVYELTVRITFS